MDFMAGGAVFGRRLMHKFPGELRLIMTSIAGLRWLFIEDIRRKPGMRRMAVDTFTRHSQRLMDIALAEQRR